MVRLSAGIGYFCAPVQRRMLITTDSAWAGGVHRGPDSVPTRSERVTLGRGSRRPTDGCKSFLINSEIQIVHNIYFFFVP